MKDSKSKLKKKGDVVGPQPRPIWLILSTIALLMIVAGTMMPLFQRDKILLFMPPLFRYIYTAGAVILLISRLFSPYKGTDSRVKRLYRIEAWSSVFFCVGAFFLFYEPYTARDWLAFTLAGGAIQIYSSIMIPRAIRKALKAIDEN